MTLKRRKVLSIVAMTAMIIQAFPSKVYASEQRKTVFIDAGHGGYDNGSAYKGYMEDNINLKISKIVEKKLQQNDIKVINSREKDDYISLSSRTDMSNKSGADLFVSIHQNASEKTSPNGIETLYMGDNKELARVMQDNIIRNTAANDRGEKKSNLQVLRDNKLPSVLVECGFISNPTEGYKLSTRDYQEKVANGIVEGIKEYFDLHENSSKTYKTALNNVNVMSDRDKNSKTIAYLPKGSKVQVIDSKFDWLKIKYNGQTGYVSGVYVK